MSATTKQLMAHVVDAVCNSSVYATPYVSLPAHVGAAGIRFYTGSMFPSEYVVIALSLSLSLHFVLSVPHLPLPMILPLTQ
jgi:hypothetical protein